MGIADTLRRPSLPQIGWVPRLIGVGAFFIAWYALASVFPNELMPFPTETVALVIELIETGRAYTHVYWTLLRTIVGFIGTMLLGIAVGIGLGSNETSRKVLTPYVLLGITVPALVWGAAATLILGFNNAAVIIAAIIVVFPFIALPVWKSVEGIDYDLVDMAKAFDIPRGRLVRRLLIPSVTPAIASASRFALGTTFNIVTIGEMLATNNGIGEQIVYTYGVYRYEEAWAWLVLFMAVILTIEYGLFKPLERRALAYRQDADFSLVR